MKYFYKYKSVEKIEFLLDIISRSRFYMPSVKELNDPMEGLYNIINHHAGSSYYSGTPMMDASFEDELSKYKILSLTTEKDNIVMRSHYAKNFNGVCIEIKADNLMQKVKQVNYCGIENEDTDLSLEENVVNALSRKHPGWSYENEWRIIDKDNQYLNLEKGEITKVIIGYKVSASVRDIIIKKCNAVGIEAEIGFIDINNCGFVEVEAPLYIKMMKDIKTGEYQGGGYEIYKEKYR